MRYTDWPWQTFSGKTGLTYATTANPKLCLHTTETKGFPNYSWPPHITFNPSENTGRQHVTGTKGAYALRSPGGGESPNYQGGLVFQIEIIGYAADTDTYPDWWYQNLAALIVDVCEDWNIPQTFHPKGFSDTNVYGENGKNRITWDQYRTFSGILGHQHVPANTHWDPGALDIVRLLEYMGGTAPDPEGEAMFPLRYKDGWTTGDRPGKRADVAVMQAMFGLDYGDQQGFYGDKTAADLAALLGLDSPVMEFGWEQAQIAASRGLLDGSAVDQGARDAANRANKRLDGITIPK